MTVKFYHNETAVFLRTKLGELLEEHPKTKGVLDTIAEKGRGCDVYIYGGWVRDTLLGKPFTDLDVVVDAGVEHNSHWRPGDLKILGQTTEELRTATRVVDSQYGDCVVHTTKEDGLTMQIWYLHETWIDIKDRGFCENLGDLFSRTDFNLNCAALRYNIWQEGVPTVFIDNRFEAEFNKTPGGIWGLKANPVLEFVNPRLWYPRRLTRKALRLLGQHETLRAGPRLLKFLRSQMEAGYRAQDKLVGAKDGLGPLNESAAEELGGEEADGGVGEG